MSPPIPCHTCHTTDTLPLAGPLWTMPCHMPHHRHSPSCRTLVDDFRERYQKRNAAPSIAPVGGDMRTLMYVLFTSGSTGRPKGVQVRPPSNLTHKQPHATTRNHTQPHATPCTTHTTIRTPQLHYRPHMQSTDPTPRLPTPPPPPACIALTPASTLPSLPPHPAALPAHPAPHHLSFCQHPSDDPCVTS